MAELWQERRSQRRAGVAALASLVREGVTVGRFLVQNLSASGALLTGRDLAKDGDLLLVRLELPGRAPMSLSARVVRRVPTPSDLTAFAVEFRHRSPDTEDAIQQVVLDALEAAVDAAPFFDAAEHDARA